jgi:hypothetical protein
MFNDLNPEFIDESFIRFKEINKDKGIVRIGNRHVIYWTLKSVIGLNSHSDTLLCEKIRFRWTAKLTKNNRDSSNTFERYLLKPAKFTNPQIPI